MARSRLELQALLQTIVPHVYFQPPTNVKLQFPCIMYKRDYAKTEFADDNPYIHTKRYMLTVIDSNPDSTISESIAKLPMCVFNRFYTSDNLNHDVYNLYF